MKTKLSNRMISMILAIVMILGVMPASAIPAFAAGTTTGTTTLEELANAGKTGFHVVTPDNEANAVYDENGKQLGNYIGTYTSDSDKGFTGTSYCLDHEKNSFTTGDGMAMQMVPRPTDNSDYVVAGNDGKSYVVGDLTAGVVAHGSNAKKSTYPQEPEFWEDVWTQYRIYKAAGGDESAWLPGQTHLSFPTGTQEEYGQIMSEWMKTSGFTQNQFDRATQLAVWHSIWNINIVGGIDSEKMPNDPNNRDYRVKVLEGNQTVDGSYQVIAVAQALLLLGFNWTEPNIKEATGGMFFGGQAEADDYFLKSVPIRNTETDGAQQNTGKTKDTLSSISNSNNENGLNASGIHTHQYQIYKDGEIKTSSTPATTGTINDLYSASTEDAYKTNKNIYKQTINGEDFYVIYFNFYTENDAQNESVTVTMDLGANAAELQKLGIFMTAVDPDKNDFQYAEFWGKDKAGNAKSLDQLSKESETLSNDQLNYGGNPQQVKLQKVEYSNTEIQIGEGANPNNDENPGNGYRYYGMAKLCVPVWAFDTQAYITKYYNELTNPSDNDFNFSLPDFDAVFTFSAPIVSQYNQYIASPKGNGKDSNGKEWDNRLQPMLLCDGPAPVNDILKIQWDGIDLHRDRTTIITPPPPSDLTLKKIDSKDKNINLQGAKFELRNVDENCSNYGKVISSTTNNQGIATFVIPICCQDYDPDESPKHFYNTTKGEPPVPTHEHVWVKCTHDWELVEVAAPPNYELNGLNVRKINAGQLSGTLYYGSFGNPILVENSIDTEGEVIINKRDSKTNGLVAATATFKLKGIGNGYETTFTTVNGSAKFQSDYPDRDNYIPYGSYACWEINPPEGYALNSEPQYFQLEQYRSSQHIELNFLNEPLNRITLQKYDMDTGKPLRGVTFDYWYNGTYQGTTEPTDINGKAYLYDLETGTYEFQEKKVPDNYMVSNEKKSVYVDTSNVNKVNYTVEFHNYQLRSIKITKLDAHSHQGVSGARFNIRNDDGSFNKNITTGSDGTATLHGLSWGTYTITETNPPKGWLLPTDGSNVKTIVIDKDLVIRDHSPVLIEVPAFVNHKEKTLIVTKVDAEMGWYLPDAEFKLTSADGSISKTGVTGADGKLTFTNLPFGTYQLEETKAPYGYDLPADPIKTIVFDMNSPDVFEVTYEDHQQVDIILYKVDAATGKPLAGAEFELQDDDGNVVGRYITDSTGTATTERLEPGVYHAYEIKAPEGYALDSTPQWVKIDTENSSPKLLRFQDVPETSLLITKLDAQTDTPLMGAVFEVRDKDGNVIGRYTTGENGTVCTEPLNPQNYDVVEVIAPDGYALDKTEHPVTIVAGKANGIVIRDNQLATLTIYKADTDNKPIAGCTFKVETADGVFVGQYVTDSSGEAVISGINAGHYIITEVDPATGYVAVGTPKTITVRYGVKNRVEFTNAEYGGLLIKLVDQADGQWLPNGQFVVTHCADNNIVFTGTTDTAGTILVSNLIPGDKYIITQTFPPDGYTIIDSEKSEFVEAGMNKLVLFEDCTAGIVIEKVDKLTQDTLAGARFQLVRNSDNIVIGEYVTGTDGLAVASGLVPGMYTAREIEAPTNYYLDTEDKLVHVKAGTTAHVTFMDTPYSGITIKSVDDATNLPLAGTVFEVYMQNGNLVGSYTTDSTGTVQTLALEPGFYVIKQIFVQEGYSYDGGDRTVEVVNGVEVTETFRSVACGTLNIYATDNQNKGLPGMRGTVTKVNGEFVAEFVTGIDGMATLTGLSAGNYFVIEDKAPDGYQPSEEKQKTVTIKSNKPTSVYFTHAKTYGVQIKTTVLQTAKPIAGAKYRVTTPDGGIIGIYTSDEAGLIYATLDPGTYVITPVMAPDGYEFSTKTETHRTETVHGDADSRVVTVKADRYTVVEFVVTQLSSVRVKLIDGNTKAGIYGIRLLLKDSKGTIVGEYWTNNEGYITLSRDLVNGKYLLEQITVPSEYALDTVPKDITILNGETTEVIWTMWKTVGQIQVELHSLDYNPTLDLAAGTLLMGGEFEVVNADTYQVVATMTSDANGVAATAGLPIGRYFIRQTKAPAYYGLSDKETEVRLKVANDVVRVQYYDPSLYLGVFNSQKSNVNVTAGTVMRYDVLAVSNCSTVQLDNFYWTIKVPTDAARIGTLYTGTWNAAVWYTVSYKTNMADYKVFMKNLSSTANHQMDLSSTALGLQSGEYVTEVRFEFGSVPSGFCLTNNPAITMYVLPSVYNGYKIISRMEVGGKYIDAWVADTSLWTTTVKNLGGTGTANDPRLPDNLPKTGY